MKFSIGYQLPSDVESMVDIIQDYQDSIAEVYFALPSHPSGRAPVENEEAQNEILFTELETISKVGISLNLLFNASCYGHQANSITLQKKVLSCLLNLKKTYPIKTVTTTSPVIARIIKAHFEEEIKIRASVNMRIGTIKQIQYLEDSFDEFCLWRQYNRDVQHIEQLYKYCRSKQKKMHLLVNSGCLYQCPWQSYHDNLVSHEYQIDNNDVLNTDFPSPCWKYVRDKNNWTSLLQNTWIRPEDISHYESLCDGMKLATRMHDNPRMVISAYANQSYAGNLLNLFEPAHSLMLKNYYIDNKSFPRDWFEKTSRCFNKCFQCNYCENILTDVLKSVKE